MQALLEAVVYLWILIAFALHGEWLGVAVMLAMPIVSIGIGLLAPSLPALRLPASDKARIKANRPRQGEPQRVYVVKRNPQHQLPYQSRPQSQFGYVYIVGSSEEGLYKIGKTTSPEKRLRSLQTACPYELDYTRWIKTDRMDELERRLHNQFSDKRTRGEWFKLAEEDLKLMELLQRSSSG